LFLQNGYKAQAEYCFNKQIENSNKLIELGRSFKEQYENYLALTLVYAATGKKEKAYENLKIYNRKKVMSLWEVSLLERSPFFDAMKDDHEFRKIVGEMHAKYQAEHEKVRKWLEKQGKL
jgi:hypothetical protein